jgi:predicted nucleotide-binding protein
MRASDELFEVADRLERASKSPELAAAEQQLTALQDRAQEVGRAASGSWLGYQANVYYADFQPPPSGAHFSQEWGLKDLSFSSLGSRGDWRDYDPHEVLAHIREGAGSPDLSAVTAAAEEAGRVFTDAKADVRSILLTENADSSDSFLSQLVAELDKLEALDASDILEIWRPKGQLISRDMIAIGQKTKVPPHQVIKAEVAAIRQAFNVCDEGAKIARKAASHLDRKAKREVRDARIGTNVFIGHGRSPAWRELKDFVQDRLQLPWDEFNRVPVAGVTNQARLAEMLDAAAIALVIMTAEDETADGQLQARMNVIHEVGLFQGRLGFTKAIVLVEEGCQEFTNIQGLGQIRFPAGNIAASFEEVRRVLERENVIEP